MGALHGVVAHCGLLCMEHQRPIRPLGFPVSRLAAGPPGKRSVCPVLLEPEIVFRVAERYLGVDEEYALRATCRTLRAAGDEYIARFAVRSKLNQHDKPWSVPQE